MRQYNSFTKRPLLQAIMQAIISLLGWRVKANFPEIPKYVMIVAPHTSNWDFPIALMAAISMDFWPQWFGKDSLFKAPFGGLMRWLGGIPVLRNSRSNFVEQVVETYHQHESLIIALAPEGTRTKTDHWKTGFYHIANGAKVPIVMAYLDYKLKEVGIGPVLYPSGNIEADLSKIQQFYKDITGRHPAKQSDIRMRPEGRQ